MEARNVLLAVTGSIAAYKAADLASRLVQAGVMVRVILTAGGSRFITPVTFEGITGESVTPGGWDAEPARTRMEHLDLAAWADLLLVAPASADVIARLAQGRSDDVLGACALAFRGPMMIAPAMETQMFTHPATATNLELLVRRGATVVGPETGRLASGGSGLGRMSDPTDIVQAVHDALQSTRDLQGVKVLVTAGPTYEPIDPVRYIGNRSSGKMGFAVALEAYRRGAHVVLVSGPTALTVPDGIRRLDVETSDAMLETVLTHAPFQDVVVMCAAVSDYKPVQVRVEKLRRGDADHIDLMPTEDIAAAASRAAPAALHIGFALESGPLLPAARDKLRRKGQALVVANQISADHNPFGSDVNETLFVTARDERVIPLTSKVEVARLLWSEAVTLLARK